MLISAALLAIALWVAGTLAPARVLAVPVTFQATELVTASSVQGVHVGDRLVTTFTFDTGATDLDPDPQRGHYAIVGSAPVLTVRDITDNPVRALLDAVAYEADILDAALQQLADDLFVDTGAGTSRLQWLLAFQPTALSSDHLPLSPPSPSAYLGAASFYTLTTDGGTISGDLVSLAAVPEPPTWLLVAVPLLASLSRKRREEVP